VWEYWERSFTEVLELSSQVQAQSRIKNVPLGNLKANFENLLKGDCGTNKQ